MYHELANDVFEFLSEIFIVTPLPRDDFLEAGKERAEAQTQVWNLVVSQLEGTVEEMFSEERSGKRIEHTQADVDKQMPFVAVQTLSEF